MHGASHEASRGRARRQSPPGYGMHRASHQPQGRGPAEGEHTLSASAALFRSSTPPGASSSSCRNFLVSRLKLKSYRQCPASPAGKVERMGQARRAASGGGNPPGGRRAAPSVAVPAKPPGAAGFTGGLYALLIRRPRRAASDMDALPSGGAPACRRGAQTRACDEGRSGTRGQVGRARGGGAWRRLLVLAPAAWSSDQIHGRS